MDVKGQHYRTIWEQPPAPPPPAPAGPPSQLPQTIQIIDQRWLPHQFTIEGLTTADQVANAITDMHVRGAGLIGAAAGYGMYLAALHAPDNHTLGAKIDQAARQLKATRPTAVNLAHAVDRQVSAIAAAASPAAKRTAALQTARAIADEDAQACARIGQHGLALIQSIADRKPDQPVNILTHCNAGWLAFVDHGSATAPLYAAHDAGIPVHVWVDETRPRNQGASLTAWELANHGVPHTVIADNTGGHLMQHGLVDAVFVGADRVTRSGDVANKIGTYLKALAAHDNNIPFYVALPSTTIDWTLTDGVKHIPIEQRNPDEVRFIQGMSNGSRRQILLTPEASPAANYGFDVTPARLVTQLITERGVCPPNEADLLNHFPEHAKAMS